MADAPKELQESFKNSKAEYRRLGKSGLKVSVPILGAMSYGNKKWLPWVLEEEESLPLLKAAYDRGINTWDTANVYSNGTSEIIIGKALKKYEIPRSKVLIFTKCFFTVGQQQDVSGMRHGDMVKVSKDYVNLTGLSRAAIFNSVNDSLARLQTDYIDLYQIHRFDPNVPIEETMEALHDLGRSGKVRYIGASSMWTYQFAMMQFVAEKHGWTKFISMQNHYSLVYREEEREMNKFCNETGVGLIPWSPLSGGRLARPVSDHGSTERSSGGVSMGGSFDATDKIIGRVQEIAERNQWTMSQVALAWINNRVSSPIVGLSSVARMEEALEVRGKKLTDEDEKYLEEPYQAVPNWGF